MNHQPECIPCFLRRVLVMSNRVTSDTWLHRKILGDVMGSLIHVDDEATPAEAMHEVFKRTAKTLGNADPFAEEKQRWKEEVLANADTIRTRLSAADDALLHALGMSIAANAVDDELSRGLTLKRLLERFDRLDGDFEHYDDFCSAVSAAKSIFVIHDSVAEIYFDRLLLEEILRRAPEGCQATSVVRSQVVLGDATREDAEALGLSEVATIIDPGLDCLGLPVSECSVEARETFENADVVIAKGQAAYQTIESDAGDREIWYLLRVKCPVMAKHFAVEIGDLLLEPN